ncbi:MAG: Gldg family protein [Opitutales bacterium]
MKIGRKPLAIVLLFIGLVLVNYLASTVPWRIDATADSIYTLSAGTKAILAKIEDPVTLEFYYSRSAGGVPIAYKNYAARVEEMLQQYRRAGAGRIVLQIIDPKPDTPAEDQATGAGLQPQQLPSGEKFYFGLVAIQAAQQKSIAVFTPQREPYLEYDLSELIHRVQQVAKKKLGLLSSLPLQGQYDLAAMQSGQPPASQFVIDQWSQTYDIEPVAPTAATLPADLDVLAVIHPENLSPQLQFAIDQFLLAGKAVFLAVDPSSQYFKQQGGQAAMYGMAPQNVSSDLPVLLKAYGVDYDPAKVVGDPLNATQVQGPDGNVANYAVWPTIVESGFNPKALPAAQLSSMLFIEPGSLAPHPGSKLTFTPLVATSPQSGEVPASALQLGAPDAADRQLVPEGKQTIAAMITGKFSTAFPDGAPKVDEKKPDRTAPATAPTPPAPSSATDLRESKTSSTLVVVADTDWLFDDYSVRKLNFLGQSAAQPINDNLAFAANTLDFLGGSNDLLSIRGKGNSLRPFTVVRRMQLVAQQRYQQQLDELESRLNEVEQKLSTLQSKQTNENQLIASPEAAKTIANFQKQEAEMRTQRRDIRAALREHIESLGNRLFLINLFFSPILVLAFGWWFYRRRAAGHL